MSLLANMRIAATAAAALLGSTVEQPPDLALRVGDARVERNDQRDSRVPCHACYSLRIPLENIGTRRIALVGVRRVLFSHARVAPISDSTMATAHTIEPGATLRLGEDETTALGALTGTHFLVLAIRFGDAQDYRTYEGRRIVFKWPVVQAALVPEELPIATEAESADVLRRAFELGGWWGDTGPEQNLPLELSAAASRRVHPAAMRLIRGRRAE